MPQNDRAPAQHQQSNAASGTAADRSPIVSPRNSSGRATADARAFRRNRLLADDVADTEKRRELNDVMSACGRRISPAVRAERQRTLPTVKMPRMRPTSRVRRGTRANDQGRDRFAPTSTPSA